MEELIAIKKKLDETKEKKARVEGQLQEVMARISERGYASLDEAEADLIQKEQAALELKTRILRKVTELRERYVW